jgi:hypothetical protein
MEQAQSFVRQLVVKGFQLYQQSNFAKMLSEKFYLKRDMRNNPF